MTFSRRTYDSDWDGPLEAQRSATLTLAGADVIAVDDALVAAREALAMINPRGLGFAQQQAITGAIHRVDAAIAALGRSRIGSGGAP